VFSQSVLLGWWWGVEGIDPSYFFNACRSYCAKLRGQLLNAILVDNDAAIPPGDIRCVATCWQAHPGLCRTKQSWCWTEIYPLWQWLSQHLLRCTPGGYYQLAFQSLHRDEPYLRTVCIGYQRQANPKLALAVRCSWAGGEGENLGTITLDLQSSELVTMTAGSMLAEAYKRTCGGTLPAVRRLTVTPIEVGELKEADVRRVVVVGTSESVFGFGEAGERGLPSKPDAHKDSDDVPTFIAPDRQRAFDRWKQVIDGGVKALSTEKKVVSKRAGDHVRARRPRADAAYIGDECASSDSSISPRVSSSSEDEGRRGGLVAEMFQDIVQKAKRISAKQASRSPAAISSDRDTHTIAALSLQI